MGKFNTDRIIGLSAMLISLLTLVIFIYQTNIIRTQSKLSVTPRISFSTTQESPRDSIIHYAISIKNKGLGPAIIESVNIINENKRHPLNFPKFFTEVYPEFQKYGSIIQSMNISLGTTLSEKESIKFFTFAFHSKNLASLMQYLGVKDGDKMPFNIEIIYSSIYGEKWKTNLHIDGHPIKL